MTPDSLHGRIIHTRERLSGLERRLTEIVRHWPELSGEVSDIRAEIADIRRDLERCSQRFYRDYPALNPILMS